MISSKQDRTGARTVQDLERKINPTKIREDIEAKTKLAIESGLKQSGGEIISYINTSADEIILKGDRLEVDSTNFKLSKDGTMEATNGKFSGEITATMGTIGGCKIVEGVLQTERTYAGRKYKTTIDGGIITFNSPQLEFTVDGVEYIDTPIMQVTVGGYPYLLCVRSKVWKEEDDGGWAYRIFPEGMVFRNSIANGAGTI